MISATISLNCYVGLDRSRVAENEGGERGGGGESGGGEQSRRICLIVSDRAIKLSQCGSDVGRGVVSQSCGQAD